MQLLIVVPLFKQAVLVPDLFSSLAAVADEVQALDARLLLLNDSPGDLELEAALAEHLPSLAAVVPTDLHVNEVNLGFVASSNIGLARAREAGADVVLLNSDALLTPGALSELNAVAALDPLTAVVSPRSNNATICNSPYPQRFRGLPSAEALAAHRIIQPFLPRVTYVPTAVGFCLYIRHSILLEFGLFDPVYAGGYNEENDLILRANQCGYRALLANHAFVHHIGKSSFAVSDVSPNDREVANRKILLERYPEYDAAVASYFSGPEFRAQSLLAGFVPARDGRLRLLFEANNLRPHHNGTFEHTRRLIEAFVKRFGTDYEIYIACTETAYRFHGLDRIPGLTCCEGNEEALGPFAAAFRCSQPFNVELLATMKRLAPVTGFLMLDTIAMDCLHLDKQGLERIWAAMLDTADLIGFNSTFTAAQFERRFSVPPSVNTFVSLCSTDVGDYASGSGMAPSAGDHILLVGNHYPHKFVRETLDLFHALPSAPPIVVLGLEVEPRDKVTSFTAGDLDQVFVDGLYDRARAVVFPSHYEGFGLPLMHALTRSKPVLVRDLPVFREIRDRTPFAANVHLCADTRALVQRAVEGVTWRPPGVSVAPVQTWESAAEALESASRRAIAKFSFEELRRKMVRLDALMQLIESRTAAGVLDLRTARGAGAAPRDPLAIAAAYTTVTRPRSLWSRVNRRLRRRTRVLDVAAPDDRMQNAAPGSLGRLSMRITSGDWTSTLLVAAMLDWADALEVGGMLELAVPARDDQSDVLDPATPGGLRIWLIGAGFYPEVIRRNDDRLAVQAIKVVTWSSPLRGPEKDDAAFTDLAYRELLGRRPDASGAQLYNQQLARGLPRRNLLKIIASSSERGKYIARHYPADWVA